ncbi:hypothetical protein Pan189_11830 [Stratiformator vulcanicus]|uniref:DUF104 domain-containing protein n=1 Tax=Stratiformator vulcanicus TaxID=2527980 RepID=A0A517QZ54_9PLAN|nr:hypothetical protein Pan189_11830 [Stratiformator vulcanicus]
MRKTLIGTVRGNSIELAGDAKLPEGQEIEVTVEFDHPADSTKVLPPGEGIRRAFGSWADDAEELDAFLEWNRASRKLERRDSAE